MTSWRAFHPKPRPNTRLRNFSLRSELDRQPIEGSDLSGSFVAWSTFGESKQRLKRSRGVFGRSSREAYGVEGSKDQVPQQTRIGFRSENACALGIRDKLGPPGHIGLPQFSSDGTRRITWKGGGEHSDRVVAQLVHGGGVCADGSTEPRRGIAMVGNRGQRCVEISERRPKTSLEKGD